MALAMLASAAMPAFAQQVGVDEAMQSARKFLSGSRTAKARAKANIPMKLAYTAEQNGKAHFYVFNSEAQDGGFVIVGGDMAAKEILGYCESGSFDYATAPDNMKWWLSQYDAQIAEGIKQGVNAREVQKKMRKAGAKITQEELITTKWNQTYPFNSMIPSLGAGIPYDSNASLATGCVATAMAQVMNYHKHPVVGTGANSYNKNWTAPVGTKTYEANFGATTYDWANMLDSYNGTYNDSQRKAVATLMYHAGVSVDMDYGQISTGGSSASSGNIGGALSTYFGYDKSAQYLFRDYYTDEEWEQIIYDEIAAHRPVIYGGQSSGSGHEFICHGYDSSLDKFAINWGWGGYCDGYFVLTGTNALKPGASGVGGAGNDAEYTGSQDIVIGIKKDEGGSVKYSLGCRNGYYLVNSEDYAVNSVNINRASDPDKQMRLQFAFFNTTIIPLDFIYGIKFYNTTTGQTFYRGCGSRSGLKPANYTGDYALDFNTNILAPGTYEVTPVYALASEPGNWQPMLYRQGMTIPTITVAGEYVEPSLTIPVSGSVITSVPAFVNGNLMTPTEHVLHIPLKNNNSTMMSEMPVYAKIITGNGWSIRGLKYTNVAAGDSRTIDLDIDPGSLTIGNTYTVEFYRRYNSSTQTFSNPYNCERIEFTYVNDKMVNSTLTAEGWGTLILPFDTNIPTGMTVYSCPSVTGNELVLTEESSIKKFTPYIVHGAANASFDFNGPETPGFDFYTVGILKGTLTDSYILQEDDFIMQDHSGTTAFYRVGTGVKNGQPSRENRCILNPGAGGSLSSVMFPSTDATSVSEIADRVNENNSIYSICGVRQSGMQKGINIIRLSDGRVMKVLTK